jgi:hypothetical protein
MFTGLTNSLVCHLSLDATGRCIVPVLPETRAPMNRGNACNLVLRCPATARDWW